MPDFFDYLMKAPDDAPENMPESSGGSGYPMYNLGSDRDLSTNYDLSGVPYNLDTGTNMGSAPETATGFSPVTTPATHKAGTARSATQNVNNRTYSDDGTDPEIEGYIRAAAEKRGVNPDVAIRIAQHEGSTTEKARRGTFATGSSWWPFQLHYGGAGTPYASYGNTAGMGNDFTQATGYQPGDPNAWQASVDYALDHAAKYGWGAWYGRKPAGVGEFDGIPGH